MLIDSKNADIEKITRMLELGGTMLSTYCDNCNAPMFKYQNKILCPVCSDQEKNTRDASEKTGAHTTEKNTFFDRIDSAVKNKIESLTESLEHETNTSVIKEQLSCIHTGIKILKDLHEIGE